MLEYEGLLYVPALAELREFEEGVYAVLGYITPENQFNYIWFQKL